LTDEHNEVQIASIEELEGLDPFKSSTVICPNLSAIAGKAIAVRIRAVQPMDLFKVSNFPLAELHQMTEDGASEGDFSAAMKEHLKAFGEDDMEHMIKQTLAACVVEPEPTPKALRNLEADAEYLFAKIMEKTTPKEVAEPAGDFREE